MRRRSNIRLTVLCAAVSVGLAAARLGAAQYVNVKDPPYNAHGDGTTDDSASIQSAINAVAANGWENSSFRQGRTSAPRVWRYRPGLKE